MLKKEIYVIFFAFLLANTTGYGMDKVSCRPIRLLTQKNCNLTMSSFLSHVQENPAGAKIFAHLLQKRLKQLHDGVDHFNELLKYQEWDSANVVKKNVLNKNLKFWKWIQKMIGQEGAWQNYIDKILKQQNPKVLLAELQANSDVSEELIRYLDDRFDILTDKTGRVQALIEQGEECAAQILANQFVIDKSQFFQNIHAVQKSELELEQLILSERFCLIRDIYIRAAYEGDCETLQRILKQIGDVSQVSNFILGQKYCGYTGLHFAVAGNNYNVLKLLCNAVEREQQAQFVLAVGPDGNTALHFAMIYKNYKTADRLFKYLGVFELHELLVKQNNDGNTALHFAQNIDGSKLLLDVCWNIRLKEFVFIKNKNGETAFDLVYKSGDQEWISELKRSIIPYNFSVAFA